MEISVGWRLASAHKRLRDSIATGAAISPQARIAAAQNSRRGTKLEAADRAIIAEIVAWLRRVVAGEHDRHGLFVDGLWIVDAAVNSTNPETELRRKCLMRLVLG